MIDRRTKIQEILDKMEPGWVVVEPFKGSVDTRCVLQNTSEGLEVQLDLPQTWFEDGELDWVEARIRRGIEAKLKQTKG